MLSTAGLVEGATLRRGRQRAYARCEREGIPHRRCGKLVVAVEPADVTRLSACTRSAPRARIALVDAAAVRPMEPDVRAPRRACTAGDGMVDAHALCLSFAEAHGASRSDAKWSRSRRRAGSRRRAEPAGERESLAAAARAARQRSRRCARRHFASPRAACATSVQRRLLRARALGTAAHFERLVYPVPGRPRAST